MRLARAGNRVLYIENMGIRTPTRSDAKRVALRLKHWDSSLSSHNVRQGAPGVHVMSPLVMPPFRPSWQRIVNRYLLGLQVKRVVRRLRMRETLLLTYLPTDRAPLLRIKMCCATDATYHLERGGWILRSRAIRLLRV